ncbi:hypothetical protein [Alkalihalobacterium chitinilyticum]|uniref:Uncharacterized protein n=1 Tax=Alkalihalobacterium chitinilyticum TaxID=2980103 RepID=A0ABT5VCJ6_9BACI|nr:hypothetical protein [Alkalihalobacterium chitinilyticum]MDE5412891.1 hypothetical protein [Alkalihalobacterium chitinilyticum]
MKHVEHELTKIKEAIDKAKDMRYRAEAKLEELENQQKRLLDELEELGVKPENLEAEIKKLEEEIERGLAETKAIIPRELMEKNE